MAHTFRRSNLTNGGSQWNMEAFSGMIQRICWWSIQSLRNTHMWPQSLGQVYMLGLNRIALVKHFQPVFGECLTTAILVTAGSNFKCPSCKVFLGHYCLWLGRRYLHSLQEILYLAWDYFHKKGWQLSALNKMKLPGIALKRLLFCSKISQFR